MFDDEAAIHVDDGAVNMGSWIAVEEAKFVPMGMVEDYEQVVDESIHLSYDVPELACKDRTSLIVFQDAEGNNRNASGIILEWIVGGKKARFILTAAHVLADAKTAQETKKAKFHKNMMVYQRW